MTNKKTIWGLGILVLAILIIWFLVGQKTNEDKTIKIGIITDLSGGAAYWGESTRDGIDILQKELSTEGIKVNFIIEDYGLDASKAASAAQKLVSIDKVDAVYAEFNPGAIATASFLKDKQIPYIYDAAVTSPLKENNLFYKTYLDYQEGCKQIAQKFKNENVTKIGLLKVNLEFGQLCEAGIKEVFGANMISEGYNLGDNDFRTQLLKIKLGGAQAVINVGFESDTANTLKVIANLKYNLLYGTVDDTVTDNIKKTYGSQLMGAWTFGFSDPSQEFQNKIKNYNITSIYGAAIAYTHLKQLVRAISECGKNTTCISQTLDSSPSDQTIGFQAYNNRIAILDMKLKQY